MERLLKYKNNLPVNSVLKAVKLKIDSKNKIF